MAAETTAPQQAAADVPPWDPSRPHHELAADVRWWVGSPLSFGMFGRLALDQVAYREVAAAVDRSGRFRENFTDRGIRSYLWGPLMLFGDESDRRASATRLRDLHGAVRGTGEGGFEGVRFSALSPQLWKWVGTSSLNVFYAGYVATMGRDLSPVEREIVYQTLRWMTEGYDLPSEASRMPETLAEMERYYEQVAAEVLEDNEFLQWANQQFDALPMPTLVGPRWLQLVLTPPWVAVRRLLARPAKVCAEGAAHPRMRELLGVRWSAGRRLECALYTALLRGFLRRLPKRVTLEPLAYNRYAYERIRAAYAGTQLESFGS